MSDATEEDGDVDLDERELCPDGGCVGVVGVDGRCKVCGTLGDGSAARRGEARAGSGPRLVTGDTT